MKITCWDCKRTAEAKGFLEPPQGWKRYLVLEGKSDWYFYLCDKCLEKRKKRGQAIGTANEARGLPTGAEKALQDFVNGGL